MDPPSAASQGLTVEPPQSLEGRESESSVQVSPREIPPEQEMTCGAPLGSGEEAVEDPGWLVWARQIFREKGAPLPLPPIPRPPRPQSRHHRNRTRWLQALALWEVADSARLAINGQWGQRVGSGAQWAYEEAPARRLPRRCTEIRPGVSSLQAAVFTAPKAETSGLVKSPNRW